MSNLGLERAIAGTRAARSSALRSAIATSSRRCALGGYNLGGEQSGHLLFLDHNTTGDGLITALQTLAIMRRTGRPLSELVSDIERFPQVLVNFRIAEKRPLESLPTVQAAVAKVGEGARRPRPRADPLQRHRAEGPRDGRRRGRGARVREYADEIAAELKRALGGDPEA